MSVLLAPDPGNLPDQGNQENVSPKSVGLSDSSPSAVTHMPGPPLLLRVILERVAIRHRSSYNATPTYVGI